MRWSYPSVANLLPDSSAFSPCISCFLRLAMAVFPQEVGSRWLRERNHFSHPFDESIPAQIRG